MFKRLLTILMIWVIPIGWGQGTLNKTLTISYTTETIQLDSLSIIPGSIVCIVHQDTLSELDYTVDYIQKSIRILRPFKDSITVFYDILNFDFTPQLSKYDSTFLFSSGMKEDWKYQISNQGNTINDFFGGNDLSKKGSLSRGVTFGNQQNLGINSTLNLELSGKLSENLNVLASISDANVPIQPEGNTQKLQSFDQVFIQLYNENLKFTGGDFWIQRPAGYFLNYKKRGQGFTTTYSFKTPQEGKLNLQTSLGLSKGKFNRQIIQGVENNQGPYRLKGAENEPFIVILAGTEKVFVDGKMLVRGQEFDYVIDYNTAEVVFTSRFLITKDTRIAIEFQYSDQTYTRSLIQQSVQYTHKKGSAWINYYHEQDIKSQPLQISLDESDKLLLRSIGDSIQNATINSIDSVGFFENQNLYKMIDSLGYDSVLVFSVNQDSAFYRTTFQWVGPQKGDYVYEKNTAYGKIYRWIAPVSGVSQGDYLPVQTLITPKRKRLITAGVSRDLGKKWKIESEFGFSENNSNLFSKLDLKNDWSWSNHTKLSHEDSVGQKGWVSTSGLEVEFLDANFTFIEPYRKVEFDRDWNVRNFHYKGPQRFVELANQFKNKKAGMIQWSVQNYGIGNDFNGTRIYSEGNLKNKTIQSKWDASVLGTQGTGQSVFIRHRLDLSYKLKPFLIGIKDDQEFNQRNTSGTTLTNVPYAFYDVQFYIQSHDTSTRSLRLFYRERWDWKPSGNVFKAAARGQTMGGEWHLKKWKAQTLGCVVGFRSLTPLDTSLLNITPDQSLIGRVEYSFRIWKGALTWDTYYEIGSGLEQKRTFIYLEVNAGQGVYTWIDYNGDGIKDLNEFEISGFIDQANYIRIFTPSSDYQKTFSNEYNQSVFWRPELIWSKKTGALHFLSRFSNQMRLRSNRKIGSWNSGSLFNPLRTEIDNTLLISSAFLFRNTLFFNRTSAVFNGQYVYSFSANKALLASGFDGKQFLFHELSLHWNVKPTFSIKIEGQQGEKHANVDYTTGRNYQIQTQQILGTFLFQPSTNYRITLGGRLADKSNAQIFGGEQCLASEITTGVKYNTTQKGSVQADVKFIQLQYEGNPFSAVAFEMLEALKPGTNYTWTLQFQRNIGKNLQMTLQYSGRKSMNSKSIHNGGMELRAFF